MLSENPEIRYSLGLFSFNDEPICVPEELVDEEHPLQYNPFNMREYFNAQKALIAHRKELTIKAFCGI